MKLFFKILSYIFIFQLFLSSCQDDKGNNSGVTGMEVPVFVKMKVPPTSTSRTRAVEEDVINQIDILVFENEGTDYEYAYRTVGYSLTEEEEDIYTFQARITASDNPLKLYFLANVSDLSEVTTGNSEAEVRAELVGPFTPAGFDTYLPMFGETDFPNGISNTMNLNIDVDMVRSAARVDVQNTSPDFTLTSVYAYRANSLYQIIPNSLTDNVATQPSIPSGATRDVTVGPFNVTGELLEEQLYLPESPVVTTADQLTATTIVVGGIYEGDVAETYYRMDFIPDNNTDALGQLLRNHRYIFIITDVLAPGWGGPDEAANNNSSDITAEIKEWNENTLYMAFDAASYFGVSSRTIVVGHTEGASNSIEVDTNVDDYRIYWLDDTGDIDENLGSITLNESFENDLFRVSINADGTRIIATALNNLDPAVDSVSSRLRVEANRLRINLRVVQRRPVFIKQSLRIYNSTQEFTLGNNTLGLGTFSPSERTRPMVNIIKNQANFGPSGTVPIIGVSIAGQDVINFPERLPDLFDVIYLTYNRNPSVATSGYITNWLDTNERAVLIVQYDNAASNGNLLSLLGITGRIQSSNVAAFTFYDDAPAEIMNGLFGVVPQGLTIRCLDTTHGEIPESVARANGITPVLRGGEGEVVLGIDFTRRIVYSGDTDIYNRLSSSNPGSSASANSDTNGVISNDVDVFLANLWGWIAEVALADREE